MVHEPRTHRVRAVDQFPSGRPAVENCGDEELSLDTDRAPREQRMPVRKPSGDTSAAPEVARPFCKERFRERPEFVSKRARDLCRISG